MRNVGKTIAMLRAERGLRQKDLSEILSMSPSNISNYEKGSYWPDLNTICKIADYFNVTTDYLLGRTDYRCSPEILDKYTSPDYVVHNIVNTLLTLDAASLDAADKYVNYLKDNHDKLLAKNKEKNSANLRKASDHSQRLKNTSKKKPVKKED